ncbi:MAG: MMPL family transporter, partial [Burkholderiales bacterium]
MKGRAGYALAAWLLLCAASLLVVRQTIFNGDISAFLPGKPSEAQKILVDQLQDGPISRMLLLAIEGGSEAERGAASKAMMEQLVAYPALAYSHNGDETRMGPERDFLLNHRYVLSDAVTPARFTQAALRDAMDNNLDMLNSPLGMLVKRVLPEDPTGEFVHLIEQFEGQSRPAQRDGVWFSRDGKRALLVTQTKAPGFDIDAQEIILRDIRQRFATVVEKNAAKQLTLLVTGPGIFAIKTRDAIRGDAERLSIIAVALIAALLLWFFRSPRVLILSLIPVATGVLAGIAAVSLAFGSVHGITLGFGVTLIGEAVDYAVYLFTQQTPERQSAETLRRIWPTLRLGLFTSVAGFSAMLFSGFPGLAQLGLFSIAGLVTAVVTTRWLLPPFLPDGFSANIASGLKQRLLAIAAHAPKFQYWVGSLVAIALVAIFWHRNTLW